jgi:hypothetical protein
MIGGEEVPLGGLVNGDANREDFVAGVMKENLIDWLG